MARGEVVGVVGKTGWQEFNRHDLAELQIFRAINFAHAAASRESNDAIAIRDDLTRGKPAAADGIGAGKEGGRARRDARGAMTRRRRMGRRAATCGGAEE